MTAVQQILDYWFGNSSDDLSVVNGFAKLWFGKDTQVDSEIRERFGELVASAATQGLLSGDEPVAERTLATIILLDQFTRNIYRGDARAFASDSIALDLALEALDAGIDQCLRPIQRVFIYLPLEHSENLAQQLRSIELFQRLAESVPEKCQPAFSSFLDYAVRHWEIVARFGRFPHRNQVLGRESTEEEAEFLKQPNSSF